jgi:hypothetical protein
VSANENGLQITRRDGRVRTSNAIGGGAPKEAPRDVRRERVARDGSVSLNASADERLQFERDSLEEMMERRFGSICPIVIACVEAESEHGRGVDQVGPDPIVIGQCRPADVQVDAGEPTEGEVAGNRGIEYTEVRAVGDGGVDRVAARVERDHRTERQR